jgi:type I restriction enzyme M protein
MDKVLAEIDAAGHGDKAALKATLANPKKTFEDARKQLIAAIKERGKQVNKAVKELGKLQEERDSREREIQQGAEREITHLQDAAADLCRICADPDEARRYFAVVDKAEIDENEFNLNLPRYVDTFEPEKVVPLQDAIRCLKETETAANTARAELERFFAKVGVETA